MMLPQRPQWAGLWEGLGTEKQTNKQTERQINIRQTQIHLNPGQMLFKANLDSNQF